jgi:curli production assembly/transport component CsgF
MMRRKRLIAAGTTALALIGLPAMAQDLSYTPTNPSFGGNPFNSSHLLGVAGAQNDYKEPTSATSQADLFSRQLQSRLLSALASQVTDAIFGDDPQESGTITFGDQTITFVRSLDSVKLSISDAATGTVTDIEIPTFVDVVG